MDTQHPSTCTSVTSRTSHSVRDGDTELPHTQYGLRDRDRAHDSSYPPSLRWLSLSISGCSGVHDPPASRTLAEDQIAYIHKTQSQGNERPGSCSNVSPATVGAKPTLGGQSFQERWVLHLPAGRVSLPQAPTLMCHRMLRHLTVLSTQPGPSTLGSKGTDLMSQSVPAPDCASGSQGPATHLCVHLFPCLALDTGRPSGSCHQEAPQGCKFSSSGLQPLVTLSRGHRS